MPTWELFADIPSWVLTGLLLLGLAAGWMANRWREARSTGPVCAGERERRRALLHQLRMGRLEDVAPELLLEPWQGTRPFVKLVAGYDKAWQVFLGQLPLGEFIRTLIGYVAAFVGFMAALATLHATVLAARNSLPGVELALLWATLRDTWGTPLAVLASPTWLGLFYQLVLPFLAGGVTVVVVFLLRGRLSLTLNALVLDLNCLYFAGAAGPEDVWWRNVITVSPKGKSWIRVWQEDGVVLLLRVPKADRCWLVEIMRQLLRHHQDLYGTCPDPAAPCPTPTEHQPELPETHHGRPQLRDWYSAFVAERNEVFAAMPAAMRDVDKRREFTDFLRWRDSGS